MVTININVVSQEYINDQWFQVTVKGIKFKGEYSVDIYYAEQSGNYVWHTIAREHIECKRVGTINKKLAAKGFTCKVN